MFIVRPGRVEDCDQIMEMIIELAIYEKFPDGPKITAETLKRDGFCENPLFRLFVAELEDTKQIIGYTLYFYKYSTWEGRGMWLEDFYVREAYRKIKVGYSLFKATVKQALSENCARFEWNVLDWNQVAIDFYKKQNAINLTEIDGWNTYRLDFNAMKQLCETK